MRFDFRQLSQEGRGSVHAEADGIELRYIIGEKPKTEKDAPIHFFSSKAHFYMEFAEEHRGKKVYVFARWKNNVKEPLSGPWFAVVEGLIF